MHEAARPAYTISTATEKNATEESIVDEMRRISAEHWTELGENTDLFELDVDWNAYRLVHRRGGLHVTQVRETRSGELIGYHVVFIRRHPHNKALCASDAVSFVRPLPDRIWILVEMYRHTVAALRARGVRYIGFRVKVRRDFGPLLERLGFTLCEKLYTLTVNDDRPNPTANG